MLGTIALLHLGPLQKLHLAATGKAKLPSEVNEPICILLSEKTVQLLLFPYRLPDTVVCNALPAVQLSIDEPVSGTVVNQALLAPLLLLCSNDEDAGLYLLSSLRTVPVKRSINNHIKSYNEELQEQLQEERQQLQEKSKQLQEER